MTPPTGTLGPLTSATSAPLSSVTGAASTSSSSPTPAPSEQQFTMAQLGGIIGGVAGGFLLLVALFACILMRQRSNKKFKRGRGITPSMVMDRNYLEQQPQLQQNQGAVSMDDRNNQHQQNSPYSFNAPQNAFGSQHFTPTSPSENITATVDEIYNIKQYNNSTEDQRRSRASANGARLSKYNYLAEAFQQMRAGQTNQQQQQQPMAELHKKESKVYAEDYPGLDAPGFVQYPDPVLASSPPRHQPVMPAAAMSPPPPKQALTTPTDKSRLQPPSTRSPKPNTSGTVSPSSTPDPANPTLHRGIISNSTVSVSNAQSTAVTKKLHFPGTSNYAGNRDSNLSEVSEYSTFSTYTDDANGYHPSPLASDKPYKFI
ncbi:hypothetical protein DM01DRAFT_1340356 [Hesseltinella vesiculosa]|uniref:Uncharacterized protein n=1 Tax=Hesseltinella vesiculosa TaxID=101127 RepID=A0A1X2G4B9_9FUNG|nr:hypothetical protein DM01DRAFT_1340356 [Hesseltinella vesiculosa]